MTLRVDFRAAVGAHLVTEEVGVSHKTGDVAFRAQIRLGRLLTPRRKYLHMVTPANQIVGAPSGPAGFGWYGRCPLTEMIFLNCCHLPFKNRKFSIELKIFEFRQVF